MHPSSSAPPGPRGREAPPGSNRGRRESHAWPWIPRESVKMTVAGGLYARFRPETRLRGIRAGELENVAAQVFVARDLGEALAHGGGVEDDVFGRVVGEREQHLLEQRGHHGVQAAGADVFKLLVDLGRDPGDLTHAILGELEGRA